MRAGGVLEGLRIDHMPRYARIVKRSTGGWNYRFRKTVGRLSSGLTATSAAHEEVKGDSGAAEVI